MSGEVVGWAMKQHTGSPAAKLVLVKLADNANEQGLCWPSIELLVEHTELGQSTVYKHLAALEVMGRITPCEVIRNGQPLKAYQLNLPGADEIEIPPRGKEEHPKNAIPYGGKKSLRRGKTIPPAGIPYKEEPSSEPSVNRHSPPAGADESDVASLGQGKPERWKEFRSAWAKTMPDGFPAKDEAAARMQFIHQTRTVDPDLLIGAVRLHGAAETQRYKNRRGQDFRTKLPSNWLRDSGYEGYLRQVESDAAAETTEAITLARVRADLGPRMVEILRNCGATDAVLAKLDGVTFDDGPPACFTVERPFQASLLRKDALCIGRALNLDGDLIIREPGQRRAG